MGRDIGEKPLNKEHLLVPHLPNNNKERQDTNNERNFDRNREQELQENNFQFLKRRVENQTELIQGDREIETGGIQED